jgi:hypothetical protein
MRALFTLSFVTLFAITIWALRVSVPSVPPPCETSPTYTAFPSVAVIGAAFLFWLGGRVGRDDTRPLEPERRRAVPVYVTLTAALLITALLLGYEVYAVAEQTRPDATITHYVRCIYGSSDLLAVVASVAGAWSLCLILGHWLSYRRNA